MDCRCCFLIQVAFSVYLPKNEQHSVRVFQGFDELEKIPNPVLTIGTFDGVHLGHQRIIQQLNEEAQKHGGESVLFTFYPHPRMVLFPDSHGLKLLQTQVEKIEKLERIGLQNVIVHPFTMEFSRLTAIEFVRDYLVNKLNVKTIVIGYDHQFGKNREGSLELLKELAPIYDFNVIEIAAQDIDDVNVSSTKIRNALKSGNIETANSFLGEPFEMNGTVQTGKQVGRSLGYPTANLDLGSSLKIVPESGVYLVRVTLSSRAEYFGMMNIGVNPTVSDNSIPSIEVHLLDYSGDLYGQELQVKVLSRLRDEVKFDNLEELKNQLSKDENTVRDMVLHSNY
jgi:riboflavin kinase / FMN adenylyltransferase